MARRSESWPDGWGLRLEGKLKQAVCQCAGSLLGVVGVRVPEYFSALFCFWAEEILLFLDRLIHLGWQQMIGQS